MHLMSSLTVWLGFSKDMLLIKTQWFAPIIKKGKEEYLYSAFIQRSVSMRSDMDHTVLPANYTMPVFPS